MAADPGTCFQLGAVTEGPLRARRHCQVLLVASPPPSQCNGPPERPETSLGDALRGSVAV